MAERVRNLQMVLGVHFGKSLISDPSRDVAGSTISCCRVRSILLLSPLERLTIKLKNYNCHASNLFQGSTSAALLNPVYVPPSFRRGARAPFPNSSAKSSLLSSRRSKCSNKRSLVFDILLTVTQCKLMRARFVSFRSSDVRKFSQAV